MMAADIVRGLPCVFQVDGIFGHSDGKGLYRMGGLPGRDRADKRGIQTAGEEKADLRIRDQTLLNARDQLVMDLFARLIHPV